MTTRSILQTTIAGLLACTLGGQLAEAQIPESTDPIKLVLNNWTSQVVLAQVTGELLEKMGYSVEYVPSDNQLQFAAMANGDLHMQVEVWEGTHITNFLNYVGEGTLLDAGTHLAITREEWWYPLYMEERCPGLPDWQALDACAELFATPETQPKGRYVGGPIDWGKYHNERVEALGMNFHVFNVGQASTLWAELDAAYRREEPVILFNWTPNWVEARYEGRFVDFPDYAPECWTDPAWGSNPDMPNGDLQRHDFSASRHQGGGQHVRHIHAKPGRLRPGHPAELRVATGPAGECDHGCRASRAGRHPLGYGAWADCWR